MDKIKSRFNKIKQTLSGKKSNKSKESPVDTPPVKNPLPPAANTTSENRNAPSASASRNPPVDRVRQPPVPREPAPREPAGGESDGS